MSDWKAVFELKEASIYGRGGLHRLGGDPEIHKDNPVTYVLIDKQTGKEVGMMPCPKYTAQQIAKKMFKKLNNEIDSILIDEV